jgi:hypothetical protein
MERYRSNWTSLGVVEIQALEVDVRRISRPSSEIKPYTRQGHLYVDVKPLDTPAIELRLRYRCKNNDECNQHFSRVIGWEYIEAFRNFLDRYGSETEAINKLKDALCRKFADTSNSAYALLGTHSRYPVWMIGQLFFFRKDLPPRLF